MVASRSMMTGPPSPLGAASPASAQARSRAAARAARIAFSARGASSASARTSREITGSDATGPARCGCSRSTATSARQSPPSATAAARSATILPGSCTARGARHWASPPDRPRPRPVTRIVSHSSTAPAWDTSPGRQRTPKRGQRVRYCSPGKCLRLGTERTLDKSHSPRSKALFSYQKITLG
jgi:hypothetical protein